MSFLLMMILWLQVPRGWDKLFVSIVSVETGKPIAKSSKAVVRNGNCQWTETLSESIWISEDDSPKEMEDYFFKLVLSMVFLILTDFVTNMFFLAIDFLYLLFQCGLWFIYLLIPKWPFDPRDRQDPASLARLQSICRIILVQPLLFQFLFHWRSALMGQFCRCVLKIYIFSLDVWYVEQKLTPLLCWIESTHISYVLANVHSMTICLKASQSLPSP